MFPSMQRIDVRRQCGTGPGCVVSDTGSGGSRSGHGGFGSCEAWAAGAAPATSTAATSSARVLLPPKVGLVVPRCGQAKTAALSAVSGLLYEFLKQPREPCSRRDGDESPAPPCARSP